MASLIQGFGLEGSITDVCLHQPGSDISSLCAVFGQSRLCKYNGQHYCSDCHHDDERVIPARVLFNWDFRKHSVCMASGEFLDRIHYTQLLDIEDVNRALYLYIPEVDEARVSLFVSFYLFVVTISLSPSLSPSLPPLSLSPSLPLETKETV